MSYIALCLLPRAVRTQLGAVLALVTLAGLAGCPGPEGGTDGGGGGDAGDTRPSVRVLNLSGRSITIIDSVTGAPIAMLAADTIVTAPIAVAPGLHTFSDLSGVVAETALSVDSNGALILVTDVLQAIPRRASDADRTVTRAACGIAAGCALEPAVAGSTIVRFHETSADVPLTSAGYRVIERRREPRRFRLPSVHPTEILVVTWEAAVVVPRDGILEYIPFDAELELVFEVGTPAIELSAFYGDTALETGARAAPVGAVDVFFGTGPRPAGAPAHSFDVAGLGPGDLGVGVIVARGTTIDSTLVVVPNAPPAMGDSILVVHMLPGAAPFSAWTRASCSGPWTNAATVAFGEAAAPFSVSACGIGTSSAAALGPENAYDDGTSYRLALGLLVPDPLTDVVAEPGYLHVLAIGAGGLSDSGYIAPVAVPAP